MKQSSFYLPGDSSYAFRGLNTRDPSTMLADSYSPDMMNVKVTDGRVQKRRGYRHLGTVISGLTSPVMALIPFETNAGVYHLVAITTTKQYRYDTSTSAWVNITYQSGAVDVNWTGDESDLVDWTIGMDENGTRKLYVTNGVDSPRVWDGTGLMTLFTSGLTYTSFVTCKTLESFRDYLILGNIETSSVEPQTIAWSDTADYTEFELGNSGALLLSDIQGEVLHMTKLGDRLAIYGADTISMLTHVGGDAIFVVEKVVERTQLLSARSVANIGAFHLFVSNEGFYFFDGSRLLREVGEEIQQTFRRLVDLSNAQLAHAFVDLPNELIYWTIPTSATTNVIFLTHFNRYNPGEMTWSLLEPANQIYTMGVFKRDDTLLWNSSSISSKTWDDMFFPWSEGSSKESFPVRVLGGAGKIYIDDEVSEDDDGTTIEAFYDSKDFVVPGEYKSLYARWIEIELELRGVSVDVYYSIDQGESYELAESLTLSGVFRRHTVYVDTHSQSFRVRIQDNNANGGFELRWLRVWFTPGGGR